MQSICRKREIFVFGRIVESVEWACALQAHLSMLRLKKSLMLLTKHHIKGIANERLPSLKCLMKQMLQTYVRLCTLNAYRFSKQPYHGNDSDERNIRGMNK